MLTITKLVSAEYLISSVAEGVEDYFMGAGEAPGVWHGSWATELGLDGVVEADALRALVEGRDPHRGAALLAGQRARKVNAFDVTLSCPKSVSLLWAFGSQEVSQGICQSQVEAMTAALDFLEERAAVSRKQLHGVRQRLGTHGFAIATFMHRTSRAGDPQLHTHCLIPNVIRRDDGTHVAFDAQLLHVWGKAAGTIFHNELQRQLSARLGVAWDPERNGTRELVGFTPEQLRAFSKRSIAIEAHLEAADEEYATAKARMQADDRASVLTRPAKDRALTPERLRERWQAEGTAVGLRDAAQVEALVADRHSAYPDLDRDSLFADLVNADTGLSATDARFGEAHVVERVAAMSAGRLDVDEIVELSIEFLTSTHVVRLAPEILPGSQRRPPQWSTVEHRALEDRVLAQLQALAQAQQPGTDISVVDAAISAARVPLGDDQVAAVAELCGPGPALRALIAPAGFGKTTAVHAGARASVSAGRRVLGVASTNRAVAELRDIGIQAMTIARLRLELVHGGLAPNTTLILDEASQTSTRDAAVVLEALASLPGAQLWCLGDVRQTQSVRAGGLAAELDRMGREGVIPAPALTTNRRQLDPDERLALARFRAEDLVGSQAIRAEHRWEHEHATPVETREALAAAAVADADVLGVEQVAVLAVSHADCEDLADRIRSLHMDRGELCGPTRSGPGWGTEVRSYATGDRVLLHANLGTGVTRLHNGAPGTVSHVGDEGVFVRFDDGRLQLLAREFVEGRRPNGDPNLSHAWARTVDGAQGGTWAQVHLLGTSALDRFRGYVGQSRGQFPTHTWNTKRLAEHDHGAVVDERQSAAEEVLAAMGREPLKTFAAADDPWVLHRRLSTERSAHVTVLETAPSYVRRQLFDARGELAGAEERRTRLAGELHRATAARATFAPLAPLRRGGREARAQLDASIVEARDALAGAERAVAGTTARLDQLRAGDDQWQTFENEHGWRRQRVTEIDDELAHHWARATLGAVREDDPLAFGIDELRQARATSAGDLHAVLRRVPRDRSGALRQAEAGATRAEEILRFADRKVARRTQEWDEAHQRHRGRRNKLAIAEAGGNLSAAEAALRTARQRVSEAREQRSTERAWEATRQQALEATKEKRTELRNALHEIDAALEETRIERVLALVHDDSPPFYVLEALGEVPLSRGGQRAWCGLAVEFERYRDRRVITNEFLALGPEPQFGVHQVADEELSRVHELIQDADGIIDAAHELDPVRRCVIDAADSPTWTAHLSEAHRHLQRTKAVEVPEAGIEAEPDMGLSW